MLPSSSVIRQTHPPPFSTTSNFRNRSALLLGPWHQMPDSREMLMESGEINFSSWRHTAATGADLEMGPEPVASR